MRAHLAWVPEQSDEPPVVGRRDHQREGVGGSDGVYVGEVHGPCPNAFHGLIQDASKRERPVQEATSGIWDQLTVAVWSFEEQLLSRPCSDGNNIATVSLLALLGVNVWLFIF